ncbi:MAG TPA: gamma-glutamylcyclotransferase [Burkholderiales bacterium]|nr:gamma-glutamylcyclotransferase [Burkholderiales bacterium]
MEIAQFLEGKPRGDLWVFGYGSLMWSPGFRASRKSVALARGYHRAMCILSHRYRGTPDKPGLVMGLCRGGSCWGMAFRVPVERVRHVLALLWKREMLNKVYKPTLIPVVVAPGRRIRALAFIADTTHRQFVGELGLRDRARLIAQGIGERGHCVDYIRNTLEHMLALGLEDPHLSRLLDAASNLSLKGKRK